MLKLEKASRDRQFNVIMRDKEGFFSRSLITAFIFAASFHLIFVLVFNITPFKLQLSQVIFPPIQVETGAKDIVVITQEEKKPFLTSGLPTPPVSQPTLEVQPAFSTPQPLEYFKENHTQNNPFQRIENEIYVPVYSPNKKMPSQNPIQVVVSGLIATKELLNNGVRETPPTLPKQAKKNPDLRTIFSVLVENKTGKVFWFEPLHQTQIPQLDLYAEKMLKDIQFTPETDAEKTTYITSGEIEIHFNNGVL